MIITHTYFNNVIGASIGVCLLAIVAFKDITTVFICPWLINLEKKINTIKTIDRTENSINTLTSIGLSLIRYLTEIISMETISSGLYWPILIIFFFFEMSISAFIFPAMANSMGRRFCLITLAVLLVIYSFSKIFWTPLLILQLFLFKSSIIILYTFLNEIACPCKRGLINSLPFAMIGVGFCIQYYLNEFEPYISLVVSLLALIFVLLFCEETPHFYLMRDEIDDAIFSFSIFRCNCDKIKCELREIDCKIKEQKSKSFLQLYNKIFKIHTLLLCLFLFYTMNLFIIIVVWCKEIIISGYISLHIYPKSLLILVILSYAAVPCLIDWWDRRVVLYASIMEMLIFKIFWILLYFCNQLSLGWLPGIVVTLLIATYNIAVGLVLILISETSIIRFKVWTLSIAIIISYFLIPLFCLIYIIHYFVVVYVPTMGILLGVSYWIGILYMLKRFDNMILETKRKTLEEIDDLLK